MTRRFPLVQFSTTLAFAAFLPLSASAKEPPKRVVPSVLARQLEEARYPQPRVADAEIGAFSKSAKGKPRVTFNRLTGAVAVLWNFKSPEEGRTPEDIARAFLRRWARLFKLPEGLEGIGHTHTVAFPNFFEVRFGQFVSDIPVHRSEIAAFVDKKGFVWEVHSTYVPDVKIAPTKTASPDDCVRSVISKIGATLRAKPRPARLTALAQRTGDLLVYEFVLPAEKPFGSWEILSRADTCEILAGRDLVEYADGSGRLFDPNPIVATRNPDLRPQSSIPNAAFSPVTLRSLDGSGVLAGEHVDTGLTKNRVRSPQLKFDYPPGSQGLSETMAYYHVTEFLRHLQFTLRLGRIPPYPVRVDAFGSCDRPDNSCYDPETDTIILGAAGVPDGEDAHVILHELGHAILKRVSAGLTTYYEGKVIAEGFSDYLATSYFAPKNFHPACFAPWDATLGHSGSPPCLRRVDTRKTYRDLKRQPGLQWEDGEVWSAVLWQIRSAIKDQKMAEQIIFTGHRGLKATSTIGQAGRRLLWTVEQLELDGSHWKAVEAALKDRGIPYGE